MYAYKGQKRRMLQTESRYYMHLAAFYGTLKLDMYRCLAMFEY